MVPGMKPGWYFVTFVDLLGQRGKLAQFKENAPKTAEEITAFDRTLAETAGVVRNVRDSIARWLESARNLNEDTLARVPSERREEFKNIITPATFQSGFSDSFVVSFPMQAPGIEERLSRARAVFDLWQTLLGLSVYSVESLAQGIPWRGGIDVGLGMRLYPNEIYGPVLASAYQLESKVAEFPRLVVGRGLLDYLTFVEHLPHTEPLDLFASQQAKACRNFIVGSDDGWPMLHILSEAVRRAPTNSIERARVASDWIGRQVIEHWKAKDEKLYRRYSRLNAYFKGALAQQSHSQ